MIKSCMSFNLYLNAVCFATYVYTCITIVQRWVRIMVIKYERKVEEEKNGEFAELCIVIYRQTQLMTDFTHEHLCYSKGYMFYEMSA